MLTINEELKAEKVKCAKCGAIIYAHPLSNMNSNFIKDCKLHNKKEEGLKNDK